MLISTGIGVGVGVGADIIGLAAVTPLFADDGEGEIGDGVVTWLVDATGEKEGVASEVLGMLILFTTAK